MMAATKMLMMTDEQPMRKASPGEKKSASLGSWLARMSGPTPIR
jgi:hypothetical protein